MQQTKKLNWSFQLFQKWTNLLFKRQNVRSVVWDSLEKQRHEFVDNLKKILPVSYQQGLKIFDEVPALRSNHQMILMKPNIEFLLAKEIKVKTIIENPFLLLMKREIIEHKLEIIEKMCPRDVNDFSPLLELKLPLLKQIAQHAKYERDIVPEGNRIYLFSKNLKLDAHIVAKHFAQNIFIFTTVLSGLQKKLRILQDYNVPSLNILQSLYVFNCSDQLLIKRLERFYSMGITNIRLWAIKCSEEHFEQYINSIWKFTIGSTNGKPYRSLRQIGMERKKHSSTEPAMNPITAPTIYTDKPKVIAKIHDLLPCDDEVAATIYYNHITYFDQLSIAKTSVSFLIENQIDNRSILDNPFLLAMDVDEIKEKLDIIKEMQPKRVADFLPLLMIDANKLAKIRDRWKKETVSIEQKHRVYYFSEKLQISPRIVSEAFAKNDRIFDWTFNLLAQKLEILCSYNVPVIEILSCLAVFARNVDTLSKKLELLSTNRNDPISPWMLCCDNDRFNRLVKQRIEKTEILDDCNNVAEYLSKRLNWSEKQLMKFQIAFPPLFKYSVPRLRDHIDYLLNEMSYTVDDINGHIFIFRCNLLEIKSRIIEFESLNHKPKLFIIASARNIYLKKIRKLCRDIENGMEKYELIEMRVRE